MTWGQLWDVPLAWCNWIHQTPWLDCLYFFNQIISDWVQTTSTITKYLENKDGEGVVNTKFEISRYFSSVRISGAVLGGRKFVESNLRTKIISYPLKQYKKETVRNLFFVFYLQSNEAIQEHFLSSLDILFRKMFQNSWKVGNPSISTSSVSVFDPSVSSLFKLFSITFIIFCTASSASFLNCFHKEYFEGLIEPSKGDPSPFSMLFSLGISSKSLWRCFATLQPYTSKSDGIKSS